MGEELVLARRDPRFDGHNRRDKRGLVVATTAAAGPATRPFGRQLRTDGMALLTVVLLLVVGFVVLYPIVLLALNSFRVGVFGQATSWGVDNWVAAFSQPRIVNALKNT